MQGQCSSIWVSRLRLQCDRVKIQMLLATAKVSQHAHHERREGGPSSELACARQGCQT